jgi:hypothetical protein
MVTIVYYKVRMYAEGEPFNALIVQGGIELVKFKEKPECFMNAAKNENLLLVVMDNNGSQFILGDENRAAIYEGAPDGFGTGKETAAHRGVSMEFSYKTANVYTYVGSIPVEAVV